MTQHDCMEKAYPTAMNVQWHPGAFGQALPNCVVMLGGYFTSHSTLLILKSFLEKNYIALGVCDISLVLFLT